VPSSCIFPRQLRGESVVTQKKKKGEKSNEKKKGGRRVGPKIPSDHEKVFRSHKSLADKGRESKRCSKKKKGKPSSRRADKREDSV